MKLKILVLLFVVTLVNSTPCKQKESVDISEGVGHANGSIIFDGVEFISEHWYELVEDGETLRLGCPCISHVCLWKCCSRGQAYLNRVCNTSDMSSVNPFNPTIYKGREPIEKQANGHFYYMFNDLLCPDGRYLVDPQNAYEEIFVQENGSLLEISRGSPQWQHPASFCVDMMVDDDISSARLIAAVCYTDVLPPDDSKVLYITYAIGLLLSVPFLLATFLVYAFIPELRNLHGMCLMAYCGGLIVAYPLLAYLKMHTDTVTGVNMLGCQIIAFIVYYTFQTSFFWLNVMCFDIWRTFSSYRGSGTDRRRERRRFIMYGAYAWGTPLVLTAITVGMNYADNVSGNLITPGFGHRRCWFGDWLSELVYFFSPVLVLVVCNIIFFSVTAHRIRSIKQETAILKGAESARSDNLRRDKQRYGLYLKLFMVMGVNWSVEIISFAIGGSNWYWVIIDLSNIVLGFFIFLIFVWKNKVRTLVRKRWRQMKGVPAVVDSSAARWETRSSTLATEDTRISTEDTALRMKELH